MPGQRALQQGKVARTGDPIENHPGERRRRIVPGEPGHQRRCRGALPARIDDQYDRPACQPRERRRRSGLAVVTGAVEQTHHAFAQHEIGLVFKPIDQRRKR